MAVGGFADVGARAAVHGEAVAVLPHDLHGASGGAGLLGEQGAEPGGVRAADGYTGPETGAGEVGDVLVGDEPALLQRDDTVGRPRGLLRVARGEQHSAAPGGVGPQNPVQPAALADGEPVGGVVEHERVRVGQQCAGQT